MGLRYFDSFENDTSGALGTLVTARLLSTSKNRGHNSGITLSVHHSHNQQRLFIWRVRDEVFMHHNEPELA